ncbi:MAG: DUF3108 domain-containing protein [Deltaproteobacteria bacterium]|nr:DUF3108 domain-containing protein [Deltaproteobacteria bacterium]
MHYNKKYFIFFLFAALILARISLAPICLANGPVHAAALQKERSIADEFLNEELVYEIGFWFFDEVAIGKVSIRQGENGEYIATLKAYTTGVVDRIVKHREDEYVSRLKLSEKGKRFVTLSFEKTIRIGRQTRHSLTVLDYDKMVMSQVSKKDGNIEKNETIELPRGKYFDDPLAAFYNFRYGVYGPLEEGREYTIYSFPKGGHIPKIYLNIASKKEKELRGKSKGEFLAHARIDKELFGSQTGEIDIFFNSDMLPIEAVAKELLFFGDVRGKLTQSGSLTEKRRAFLPVTAK